MCINGECMWGSGLEQDGVRTNKSKRKWKLGLLGTGLGFRAYLLVLVGDL